MVLSKRLTDINVSCVLLAVFLVRFCHIIECIKKVIQNVFRWQNSYNLDELENSEYSVSILDTPISLEQAEGVRSYVYFTKGGE